MQDLEVTPLNDDYDLYKVCLEDNGIRACTLVSSMHLVEDKRRQLSLSILNTSKQAFDV
jgi:hypothetical protein